MLHRSASASGASSCSNMAWNSDLRIYGYLPSADYVTQSAGRQVLLVMVFVGYHLWFQVDYACQCTSDRSLLHCYSYMVLPSLIITTVIIWNDKRIGRIFRFTCYHASVRKGKFNCTGKFCLEFFLYMFQAASSAFLWCGSVLVDGDWYVCCIETSEDFKSLACLKENEIGSVEKARKVYLKNQSMVIGLLCILLTAVCSLLMVLPWSTWCTRRNHFRASFEEAILEQTEHIVWKEMEKAATEAVTKSLDSLSNPATSATPSTTKSAPEASEKAESKEKMRLNTNVNWGEIASLADALIESIPYYSPQNNKTKCSADNDANEDQMQVEEET